MLALLRRIEDLNITLKGDLDFVNEWDYFSDGTWCSSTLEATLMLTHVFRSVIPA